MILQIGSVARAGPTQGMPSLGIPSVGPTVEIRSVGSAVDWSLAWELAGVIPKPPDFLAISTVRAGTHE